MDAGYIHGTDGKLQPGAPITRAEFAQVLFNLAGNVVDEGQTLSSDVSGNLIVRGSDVKLKNMQIAGDLILAEGAADVKLDNVSVGGRILVKGGSAGVSMTGTKAAKGVLVSSRGKEALLSAKESQLGTVSIQRDTTLSGDYAGVDVQKKAKVTIASGKTQQIQVNAAAEDTLIQVEKDGTVTQIQAGAKGTKIAGEGKVTEVHASGDDIKVSTKDTKVTAADGITGLQVQEKEGAADSAKKETTKKNKHHSSGGSSSGGSSSGGSGGSGGTVPKPTKDLADGIWYGTGSESLYYETKGPDIVRVEIKDGKVFAAYREKYIEDEAYIRGQNILDHVKNFRQVEDVDQLLEQLQKKEGAAYDSISGATETAKGHLSAVKNAIQRSNKYASDKKAQTVMWFDFVKGPKANMNFGDKLDLKDTQLKLHFADGQSKVVSFADLAQYGITTNIADGTVITRDTPELNRFHILQLRFQQEDSLIVMPAKVVVTEKSNRQTPSHLLIHFEDGKDQRVELNDNEFNYEIEAEGHISSIKIYDKDRLLADAVYHEEYNDWEIDLSEIPVGEGFTGWKFHTYYISIANDSDHSAVTSFTLDTEYLQKTYGVGYTLDLEPLNLNLTTEKGSAQRMEGWEQCKARGFTASPDHGYTFTKEDAKAGTKTIEIRNGNVTQSFEVKVADYEKQIPAKIEISSKDGKLLKTIQITAEEWKKAHGMVSTNITLPKEYENWEVESFSLKVYNGAEELLSDYTLSKQIAGRALEITLPHYTEYDAYGGYVRLLLAFGEEPTPEPVSLPDGDWYGTATWSRYYADKGPHVVKVTVKDGVITQAESVKYTDDNRPAYVKGKNILEKVVGLSDLSSISKQLKERKGEAFDAVGGATETAKGYVSAIENALDRAKQYGQDQQDQQIAWMEYKTKPASPAKFNAPLDLSQTELVLHLLNGTEKTVPFADFQENGITANYNNGDTITPQTEGIKDGVLLIQFTHGLSKTTLPTNIVFLQESKQRVPSHILVTKTDGGTEKIQLEDTKFRYDLKVEGGIQSMALYDGEQKLAEGTYEAEYNAWKLNLKEIPVGDGFTSWKFETYYVNLDTSHDDSDVKYFTLDTHLVPKQYSVGDSLQLDRLGISLETVKGSSQRLNGWSNCLAKGFQSSLENGHVFTSGEAGKQTITISIGDKQQTFEVTVMDFASQVPAKVELYDAKSDQLVQTIPVDQDDWKRMKGCITKTGIQLPDTYQNWKPESFKVKIYNKENQLLEDSLYRVGLDHYKEALEIDFPQYQEYYSEGGYLKLYFSLTAGPVKPKNETAEGEATVTGFNYQAKVTVTYDKDTKTIVSVTDNGTEPGDNKSFWDKAAAMFESFKGKKPEEIDSVDAIATATVSSNAIKDAVKKAMGVDTPTTEPEEKTETAEGEATVTGFNYQAKVTVTYDKDTKTIVSVTDNGTEPGDNKSFWDKAAAMFESFKGKKPEEIDSVDAIATATVSSNAIKDAVKKAMGVDTPTTEPEEKTETAEGEATVAGFNYQAKVTVTYDKDTKTIVSVTDNGTEPGGNKSFWDKAAAMFESFKGKKPEEIDSVDAIATATVSSNAIKDAVKKAMGVDTPTTEPEEKTETAEGEAEVAEFNYQAKVTVTYDKDSKAVVSVADNGTEPGNNLSFWKNAIALFEAFKGKTEGEIDNIDAVTGATRSSDAIKEAVKSALGKKKRT